MFENLKQGVGIQRHLFCDQLYIITNPFFLNFCYIINKHGDEPLSVTLLLETENMVSLNGLIFIAWELIGHLKPNTIGTL